ncbi:MAG: hypothetical protein AB7G68_05365 [Nitrospiraceae bacterium]
MNRPTNRVREGAHLLLSRTRESVIIRRPRDPIGGSYGTEPRQLEREAYHITASEASPEIAPAPLFAAMPGR